MDHNLRRQEGTGCVRCDGPSFVPDGPDALRPRINNGHVDNIEIHVLDGGRRNFLKKGRIFSLEYLLIVGPDLEDWTWMKI